MKKELTLTQITDTSDVCWDISDEQAMAIGYGLCDLARAYLQDPQNMAAFEKWREERRRTRREECAQ